MIKLLDLPTEILEHVISFIRPPKQALSLEDVQALFRLRSVNSAFSRYLSPAVILSSIEIRLSDPGRVESGPLIQRLASSGLSAAITSLGVLDDFEPSRSMHLKGEEEMSRFLQNKSAVYEALRALHQQCGTTLRLLSVTSQKFYFDWKFGRPTWTLTHLAAPFDLYIFSSDILRNIPTLTALALLSGLTGELLYARFQEVLLSKISSTQVPKHITHLYVEHANRETTQHFLRVLPIQPVHLDLTLHPGQTAGVVDILHTVAKSRHLSKRLVELSVAGVHDASEAIQSVALPEGLPASVKVRLLENPTANRPLWVQT